MWSPSPSLLSAWLLNAHVHRPFRPLVFLSGACCLPYPCAPAVAALLFGLPLICEPVSPRNPSSRPHANPISFSVFSHPYLLTYQPTCTASSMRHSFNASMTHHITTLRT